MARFDQDAIRLDEYEPTSLAIISTGSHQSARQHEGALGDAASTLAAIAKETHHETKFKS